MKVFISWSGDRSEALATALREWLPLVLHYVSPWLSKSDIQPGGRWSVEIAKELEACNFGIICITKENLNAPWILFEAGALAKSMQEGRVVPLLLDIDFKEFTGPLAQFQAKKVERASIQELMIGLNKVAATPVPENQFEKLFKALWTDFEKQITAIPKSSTPPQKHSRPQGEILEELVAGIRSVELRVREMSDDESTVRFRRRRHKTHPQFTIEMAHRLARNRRDPIQILILASLLREELPWLYELAADAFRTRKADGRTAEHAHRQLAEALELLDRRGFADELGVDPYILHIISQLLHEVHPSRRTIDARPKSVPVGASPTPPPEDVPPASG